MLKGEEIGQLILDPENGSEQHLDALLELSAQYPYSSIFSLLYLIILRNTNSLRFEEELKKHAFRVADRKNLYRLTHREKIEQENVVAKIELPVDELGVEETITLEATEPIVDPVISDIPGIVSIAPEENPIEELHVEEKSENLAEPISEEVENESLEEEASDIESLNEESREPIVEKDLSDPIEANIQYNILVSGYHLEELNAEEERQLELKHTKEKEVLSISDEPMIEDAPISNKPHDFMGWLHANKSEEILPVQQPDVSTLRVNEFREFDPLEELSGEVTKPRKEFFSPAKKAKASLDDSTMPISETLAKVFVLQGNFPKAIQVYEQLMLKFPEKKVFFANSIEQIKEKLKSIE